MIEKSIEQVFAKYDIPACLAGLECDGSTNLISQVLQHEKIEHKVVHGWLINADNWPENEAIMLVPHLWIAITTGPNLNLFVDFKAQMWVGQLPHMEFLIQSQSTDLEYRFYEIDKVYWPVWFPELAMILASIKLV